MPYRRRFTAKMPDFDDEVTVVDVYDLASDIGKECEIIIEKYGPDAVTALLPKVINALELLENLAVRNEKENQALQELTAKISQLENDKIEKAEYRQRFEKEIEAIEEQWRTESAELVTAVARLQDENKRLRRTINAPADGSSAPPSPAREHDQEVLSRLSSTAEKQRATLRHQELQLQEKQQLIDSLTNQVEKLAQVSRDLRRKHKQIQNQLQPNNCDRGVTLVETFMSPQKPEMRLVCEERSELTAIVQSQQRDIAALQQDSAQNKKCPTCGVATPEGGDEDSQSSRPTFSVRELRAILHERNELKLKLSRAEEQLHALQHDQQHDSGSDTSPSVSTAAPEEEEAPVQGPLPAEPDDAPWKRNSGIRKFFRKLFAESDLAVGGFPRRPLSSLSRGGPAPPAGASAPA
ncbi:RILP-like protein homolog isoform X2 [Trichoplusia ni]|uniref:RILP-like protein homolog isoform X2 n=1 Tax=Trichoplusia ni TaxID=7111 RepID=A0A7E5VJB1_TRINI|nr:RILP-like protein homolog isoform X2 [Trichoplusia ni]